ncbi:anti-sigma factor [Streptomyces sp. NBC_00637]|uniref:anti-sigma factor n=1 Tax=Streptomyces sp. NBC_00637 TaxID=2903667 RepID=UPI00324804BF
MITSDPHTLSGAYALHALEDDERAAFARHLAGCEPCAREVEEFTATAARLGLAVSLRPAPGTREQVLRRIAGVRQATPARAPWDRSERRARRAWWASRWVLAACLAATAALGGTTVWQYQRAEDARAVAGRSERASAELSAVLAAPDTRSRTVRLADGAEATVVVSASLDRAVFLAAGMAEPPGGKVYQLWFDEQGVMRDAGLMDPRRTSQAVVLRGTVDDASRVGITVEPAGGSEKPTLPPVALLPFPA